MKLSPLDRSRIVHRTVRTFIEAFPEGPIDDEEAFGIAFAVTVSLIATVAATTRTDKCALCAAFRERLCGALRNFDNPEVNRAMLE